MRYGERHSWVLTSSQIANIPPTAESPVQLRTYYSTEMKAIAECIFYIYYQTTITADEADKVLQLVKEFSKAVKYQGTMCVQRARRAKSDAQVARSALRRPPRDREASAASFPWSL